MAKIVFSHSSQEEGHAMLWEPRGEAPGLASRQRQRQGRGLCQEPLRAGHGQQLRTGLFEQLQGLSRVSDVWLWVARAGGYCPG